MDGAFPGPTPRQVVGPVPERPCVRPVLLQEGLAMSDKRQTRQSEDFERPELLAFQERTSRIQTVAQWIVALLVLAALAGVFGGGGLSQASHSDSSGRFQVEFARFTRSDHSSELKLSFSGFDPAAKEVELWIDAEWLESVEIESIQPEPERTEIGDRRLIYFFPRQETATEGTVTFRVRHHGVGKISGLAGLGSGPAIAFEQFTYP